MNNTIGNLIKYLHELENFLLKGSISDGGSTKYLYKSLKNGVNILEQDYLNNQMTDEEWKENILNFKRFYYDLKKSKLGLDSLFIWSEIYEERRRLINELDSVREKIIFLLETLTLLEN
ncbi:hypothetical protein [Psychrobacillus vulpis]|uniref:Uncharacterized protein n=1 Tax=Psychrobacillus vulpis TaxID=2325572 RepID=A0A544TFJ7_9BACI|nr:hypothetical protein [Psychrobacillus vulpis]TQR16227.1 hypothetical protein FG384_18945 [Psychrobacillus vulpis]